MLTCLVLNHSHTRLLNLISAAVIITSHRMHVTARSAKMRAEMDMGLICWTQPTALTTQPDPTQASRPGTVQHYRTVLRQKCPGHRFDHQGGVKILLLQKEHNGALLWLKPNFKLLPFKFWWEITQNRK